ncbi:Carboxymuconolactone decarboxylase [Methylorubrum populi BJ001]|uniref:Carboxymuconolactone decarboxylase n=1 Tax=Methylorubrum populi (strain ATCC BAA-705 / NCIMB 13946 / BJ001) TaxID=441620 RepID=B1Z9I6_METPB|nr:MULTISPECIES: carboxymuconolactone decarboxylase family protein [Methylorubrum]ACB81950.1 Carboxymuconolactone decarboxylase [Methylorubrum populi BJ001]MBB5765948.1 4-carboxymuconolactone decarboxylase [Methylorubrum rhodesianum]
MSNDVIDGGRLPTLRRADLDPQQAEAYEYIDTTLIPWADKAGFKGKAGDGSFYGPFNAFLYSPVVAQGMFRFMEAESKGTALTPRVREVVILSVASVWQAAYEIYAHSAIARRNGFSQEAIDALAVGKPSPELDDQEALAQKLTLELVMQRKISDATYWAAAETFGRRGVVDMTFLIGEYLYTSAALNAFEIPVPAEPDGSSHASKREQQ